ncbi:MAG: patatin-like phospholipase family protein [Candidatus Dormiibacterota bacterium]
MPKRVAPARKAPTVGLVLGAGGFVGGAWLTGALLALEDLTGWRPWRADHIVGTSAGAAIAAMVAGGAAPEEIPELFYGEGLEELREQPGQMARPRGATFRWREGWLPALGSPRLAWDALRNPGSVPAGMAMAALLPRGFVDTEPIKEMVRRVVPEGWAPHRRLWIVACDLDTGNRVPFGSDGAPPTDLAHAVAASCAIPGFYGPVRIEGRDYVDGGCWSTSNLDMLKHAGLDIVVCLNPTSSALPGERWHERLRNVYRAANGRRLDREAAMVEHAGTEVALVQPGPDDILAMGNNYMRSSNLDRVTDVARESVGRQLEQTHSWVLDALRVQPAEKRAREGVIVRTLSRISSKRTVIQAKPAVAPVRQAKTA